MSVLTMPLLLIDKLKAGELALSVTSCPLIIILENTLVSRKKIWYGNFNRRYNVSPTHLHAYLGVGNFTKLVHVGADRL
jgi:hypothetical protein